MLYSGREKIDQMDSEQFLYDGRAVHEYFITFGIP